MSAGLNLVRVHLAAKTWVMVPPPEVLRTREQIAALPLLERFPGEPHVRRLASVGSGKGVFAAYAALRFPYAYVDAFGGDGQLLSMNAQSGTRFFPELPDFLPAGCDALHVGPGASLQFNETDLLGLQVVVWELEGNSRMFANVAGLLVEYGMTLAMARTYGSDRGFQFWIRAAASAAEGVAA